MPNEYDALSKDIGSESRRQDLYKSFFFIRDMDREDLVDGIVSRVGGAPSVAGSSNSVMYVLPAQMPQSVDERVKKRFDDCDVTAVFVRGYAENVGKARLETEKIINKAVDDMMIRGYGNKITSWVNSWNLMDTYDVLSKNDPVLASLEYPSYGRNSEYSKDKSDFLSVDDTKKIVV